MRAARETWVNPALSLLLCTAGGALFAFMSIPLPWMIGPLVLMALCNFAGAQLRAPFAGRQVGQVVIGTALGLYFTPAVAREVISFWHLLLFAALLAIALGWVGGWILSRATGTDRTTAFFASVPGGATEMAVLGERFGAKVDRVALAQSLRILIVVIVVPFALTYSGTQGAHSFEPARTALDTPRLLLLLALAAAAGGCVKLARLPNPFMLGPLFAVIALTTAEIPFSSMPGAVSNAGQVLLGCALGSRFEQRFLKRVPGFVAGAAASILIAIALAGTAGALLAIALGLPLPTVVLATAPGGIAEMCITAKVLQLGVPLVTAAHVTRVIVLTTTTGAAFRVARSLALRRARA